MHLIDEALGAFLTELFDSYEVHVEIAHCDLTTKGNVNMTTVLKELWGFVDAVRKKYCWKKSDFRQIVHLVDMDGAFVIDNAVVEDMNAHHPVYTLSEIRADRVNDIRARNKQKSGCLERISIASELSGIPYQAYYMASNLDHVLYDKLNLGRDDKIKNAFSFARKYRNDFNGLVDFFCNSYFSICSDFLSSWAFIKEDMHSLERHTNLGICIQRAIEKKN